MPIPNIEPGSSYTYDEIVRMYEELGWTKELIFEWIQKNQRTGRLEVLTWYFHADRIPCTNTPQCASSAATFVQFRPTGVMWTCAQCRKTDGPITHELGQEFGDRRRAINEDEAWKIIMRTGQRAPPGLEKPKGPRIVIHR